MLVEPVAREPADDPVVPPAGGAHVLDPGPRRVPVVVDVVVVEDHRRRHRREQPADVRLRPRVAVEQRVLLEVRDLLARRDGDVAALADLLDDLGRDLVGVDLVAEQDERVRPDVEVAAAHVVGQDPQRVDLAAVRVLVLGQRVRRPVRGAHPARAPGDPERRAGVVRADDARRIRREVLRPDARAVEPDLVGDRRRGLEPGDVDERVVVAVDPERRLAAAEHLDLARAVGLDPDRRVVRAGVPEQRAEDQARHQAASALSARTASISAGSSPVPSTVSDAVTARRRRACAACASR